MRPTARAVVMGLVIGQVVGCVALVLLAVVQAPEGWEGVLVLVYGLVGLLVGGALGALIGWVVGRRRTAGGPGT